MIKLVKIIVYSNFFVSCCVVALTYRSLLLFNLPVSENVNLLILVGLATFFTYNFQRIVRFEQQPTSTYLLNSRLEWMYNNRNYLKSATIASTVFMLNAIFSLHFSGVLVLFLVGFIAIFYVIKFIPYKKKWLSLREIPYLKLFLIALVWSGVTVGLPFLNQKNLPVFSTNFYLILMQQFLFILAITIPFDSRDIEFDTTQNIKTLPILFGKKKAVLLSVLLLLVCIALSVFKWQNSPNEPHYVFWYESIAFLITTIIIIPTKNVQHELYYALFIEGTMLLLAFSVII